MSLESLDCVDIDVRNVNKKPVDDEETTFDHFNEETFSGMEEWQPDDEVTSGGNEDTKKEDSIDHSGIMTLINSLDLDLSSEDRELPQQSPEGSCHQRVQHNSWGAKHYQQQERRLESLFPQNAGNYADERNMTHEIEEELRRSDQFDRDHGRARYAVSQTSGSRRSSSNFGCGYYKDVRNTSLMSPHNFSRRNSAFRQDNFDLRNVETFGIDAVERHHSGSAPTKPQILVPYSRAEEDLVVSQSHSAFAEDSFRCPEIRDPRVQDLYFETCRKLHMAPMFSQMEHAKEDIVQQQLNEIKNTAFEHLKNIAELIPRIEVMEDVFDRLTDPEDPPCEPERIDLLDRLKQQVTPQNVLPFSKMVHARRLLMHSLSIMSREKRYRDHALEILEEIVRNLETLLYEDRNDMVFGLKNHVFQRIISNCSMEEIIRLTSCLLTNNCEMAIESKLGLCFIGCLLETASNLDFRSYPTWTGKWLLKFKAHLLRVQRTDVVFTIVREPGLRHLIDNTKNNNNNNSNNNNNNYSRPKASFDNLRSPAAY